MGAPAAFQARQLSIGWTIGLFGARKERLVDLDPAVPVMECEWVISSGNEQFAAVLGTRTESHTTGVTPAGDIVPMDTFMQREWELAIRRYRTSADNPKAERIMEYGVFATTSRADSVAILAALESLSQ